MDLEKKPCPMLSVNGNIASGKQFDLDITLPEDYRDVIYGVVKNCYKEPICDAVVKLIDVVKEHGITVKKPVTHTFTNEDGEFVFGPLCPNKHYELQIWVNNVKHLKICAKGFREGKCLKGANIEKCDCFIKNNNKDCHHRESEDLNTLDNLDESNSSDTELSNEDN